ncbi:hypothetical protein HAV15_003946 [Penicillium sp. str. |nr:hypothetical protein HAV15_003946 [Penicillium sp. str. \
MRNFSPRPKVPDIPGTPPSDKSEGDNYLAFLVILKNLLKDKSVSITTPGLYWYLKGFPIAKISCDNRSYLRSYINITETRQSLSLITKAGMDSGKVVIGVSSYGRSFKMADADYDGPLCKFTGGRLNSNADKAECTDTAGYISNTEIN